MTNQTEHPLNKPSSEQNQGMGSIAKNALDQTVKLLGYIFAPFIIIRFLREGFDDVEFALEKPLLSFTFLLFCAFVLIYFTFNQTGFRHVKMKAFRLASISLSSIKEGMHWKSMVRVTGVMTSITALGLVIVGFFFVYVSGLHYVVIASAPNEQAAVQEIMSINSYIEQQGEGELRARAYASTGTDSNWYMIAIGGFHTSREAAERTFDKARSILGDRMRDDAYIYSTSNISPFNQIQVYAKRLLT